MKKNYQLISGKKHGDCLRACITSILEIPNTHDLPDIADPEFMVKWRKFLKQFGLQLEYDQKRIWRQGYWIANVVSKNLPKPYTHAIVMFGYNVAFDPSTKKRYRTGRNMLKSRNIVLGGEYFVVIDPTNLHKLAEYKASQ